MFQNFTSVIAMSQPQGQGGAGGSSMVSTLIMFGAIILIMYFLMIRPQQKRQKEHKAMLESIKKGDKVITNAGMHGTVTDVDEKTYEVQVAENTKIRFEKSSIAAKK